MTPYSASPQPYRRSAAEPKTSAMDGLWVTYRWMSLGLAVTALVAWAVGNSPPALEFIFRNRPVFWGLLIAQLAMAWTFNGVAARSSTLITGVMFLAFAGITGLTLSSVFVLYTGTSIFLTFAITAGAFGGLSLYGLVTKRDLSVIGRFAMFALIGLILASVLNMFLHSTGLQWITSFVGVLIFGALTAYDTQKLRELFALSDGTGNLPLRGALVLYLDFVNMFLFLLRLFGNRRSN